MTRDHLPERAFPIHFGDDQMAGVGFCLGCSVVVEGPGRLGEYGWPGAASTHFWISPSDDLFALAFQAGA